MRKLSIFAKLFLSVFLVATVCLFAFGLLVYLNQKDALIERTSQQLKSVNILKKRSVEKRLFDDEKFIWNFTKKVMLLDTSNKLSAEKEFSRHKDFLRDFCKEYGHLQVMLLDEDEFIVDSLFEENHYPALQGDKGFSFVRIFLIDHSPYRIGLISGTDYLQKLLFENTGMGNTGESYLVRENKKMITQSRFFPDMVPQTIIVNTPSVEMALRKETGTQLTKDYRNVQVLSAFTPIGHKSLHWVLISEIDLSEAMQPVLKLRHILLFVSILILVIALLVALYLGRIIVTPIRQVSSGMLGLSEGLIPDKILPPFYESEESKMKLALNKLIGSFEGITNFASEIGSGNLNADFKPLGQKDELSRSLVNMREQLKDYREKEKLLRRQKALSLLEGQENERKRIAMELHDGVGQWLTGIKLKIAVIDVPEDQRTELKQMVSDTINETRRITNNLMPSTLIDFGLDSALKQMISNIQKDVPIKINYKYELLAEKAELPFEVTLSLYRIAQEALNNILKHSQASSVDVLIRELKEDMDMTIQDDGIGLRKNYTSGNGLGNMEERARLIGGNFSIDRLDQGTRIHVVVPINNTKTFYA